MNQASNIAGESAAYRCILMDCVRYRGEELSL